MKPGVYITIVHLGTDDVELRAIMLDLAGGAIARQHDFELVNSPEFQALLGLVRDGRCWVKLSGAHRVSRLPYPHRDVTAFTEALIEAAADRLIWASDCDPAV